MNEINLTSHRQCVLVVEGFFLARPSILSFISIEGSQGELDGLETRHI